MSERKVLNKYYPPDFDPSKIPRMKLPKNRQYTVRLMAPFNMRCETCGEYIYKGKKFNARKEDVENEDYLGIRIYRFYIKCTRCLQEISFKTDPKSTDYVIEAGATRNFMALKLAEEQALREEVEAKEEEANNPMKLLENRTKQSKNEIELLESLEEIKDMNRRQEGIDYNAMLLQYDSKLSEREREEKMRQMDEEYIKTVKFRQDVQKRKVIVEEEIIEEPLEKISKTKDNDSRDEPSREDDPLISFPTTLSQWKFSKTVKPPKKSSQVLVKPKRSYQDQKSSDEILKNVEEKSTTEETKVTQISFTDSKSALSLLGEYSDSDESDH